MGDVGMALSAAIFEKWMYAVAYYTILFLDILKLDTL